MSATIEFTEEHEQGLRNRLPELGVPQLPEETFQVLKQELFSSLSQAYADGTCAGSKIETIQVDPSQLDIVNEDIKRRNAEDYRLYATAIVREIGLSAEEYKAFTNMIACSMASYFNKASLAHVQEIVKSYARGDDAHH